METGNVPSGPGKPRRNWFARKVNDVGIFTVRDNDFLVVKAFKYVVNYTIFGFVMFMTGIVWIVTMLVV